MQAKGEIAPEVRLLQGVSADGDAKAVPLLTLEAIADSIISSGLATASEVSTAIEDLRAFTTDPDTLISDPRIFQVWTHRGTRDATPGHKARHMPPAQSGNLPPQPVVPVRDHEICRAEEGPPATAEAAFRPHGH